jgi:alpha-ribazole phosphatase
MTVTRWWWIRHAPVTTDGGRVYGQIDLPADTSDARPYPYLVSALPKKAVWITSHLRRTHQTADALREAGQAFDTPIISHAFAEQNFGEWQGELRSEIFEKYGADHGFWLAPATESPPGGESFAEVMERVSAAIEDFTRLYAGEDIICVAHGGSIRAAVGHALNLPADGALNFSIDNCSLTRLDHIVGQDGRSAWRVDRLNDLPHRATG